MSFVQRRVLTVLAWAVLQPAYAQGPSLGDARSFAVLGGASVTNRGTTRVIGNVGVAPGDAVSGFAAGTIALGGIHRDDALARAARRDTDAVFAALASGACAPISAAALRPGIYCVSSPLEGTLTLDGEADGVWIFRAEGPLRTAPEMTVVLTGGAAAANVFWRAADSVTLAARTRFAGNVLARGDITLEAGAALYGRALSARAVALDASDVTVCCDPIALSPLGPADETITASGGTPPYSFAASPLPPGWTLSASGALTRGPAAGTYTFTVTATDAKGCTGSRAYEVTICPRIRLPDLEPVWPVGSTIPAPDLSPYAIRGLPLTLTALGPHTFTVTATDPATGCVAARREYTVVAACIPPVAIAVVRPDSGTVGEPYCATIAVAPEGRSYTYAETPIPGLTRLCGVPAEPGTFAYVLTATDEYGCSDSYTATIEIEEPPDPCPEVLPALALHGGAVGVKYEAGLAFEGSAEDLPRGLRIEGRFLRGEPEQAGDFRFDVLESGVACPRLQPYTLTIVECGAIAVEPEELPGAAEGAEYAVTLTASGGTGPYTFTHPKPLPAGLSLSLAGVLSGTPAAAGTYSIVIDVRDANGCEGGRTYCAFDVNAVEDCPELTLAPAALPAARPGMPYAATVVASGGAVPYTYTVSAGALPPGVSLDPMTGDISGAPLTGGRFAFTIAAVDDSGCRVSRCYAIVVADAIPTLSEWMLLVLAAVLSCAAIRRLS